MRGKQAPKRHIENDYIYKNKLVTRIINKVMYGGKKSISERIVYGALERVGKVKETDNPISILDKAFLNLMPKQEVRSRRMGGSNYQIPVSVKFERSQALAIRWLLMAARSKKGKPMERALSEAILEACENRGEAIKKKDDVQRMANANRAFAHFRW